MPQPSASNDVASNMRTLAASFQNVGFGDEMTMASLANVMKESGGVSRTENMNYSSVARIREVFGGNSTASGGKVRDQSDATLASLVRNPKGLADFMYGHRMGNEGEGYKFRGRGFVQLTGKNNYESASNAIFGDNRLVENPDLAADPAIAAQVSAHFMKSNAPNIAKQMGVSATGDMTQSQANLLATSTIAGRKLTPGKSFAGTEGLNKVTSLASSMESYLPTATVAPGYGNDRFGAAAPNQPPFNSVLPAATALSADVSNPNQDFTSLENAISMLTSEFTNMQNVLQSRDAAMAGSLEELVSLKRTSNGTANKMLQNSQG